MRFTPKSEDEIAGAGLLPAGDYDFDVHEAVDAESKAGNDMVSLTLHVYSPDGSRRTVFDYLVDTEKAAYKIRHFAEAVGMMAAYERGELRADDMAGKSGRCKITIRKSEGYPDKNSVADYLKPKAGTVTRAPAPRKPAMASADLDDEVPF